MQWEGTGRGLERQSHNRSLPSPEVLCTLMALGTKDDCTAQSYSIAEWTLLQLLLCSAKVWWRGWLPLSMMIAYSMCASPPLQPSVRPVSSQELNQPSWPVFVQPPDVPFCHVSSPADSSIEMDTCHDWVVEPWLEHNLLTNHPCYIPLFPFYIDNCTDYSIWNHFKPQKKY